MAALGALGAGCARSGFGAGELSRRDAQLEASVFGTGIWQFGALEHVDALNSASGEGEISFSGDGLRVYISTDRSSRSGDIFAAERSSTSATFGPLEPLSAMNSDVYDAIAESIDGLLAALCTDRDGGRGGVDLWLGARPDRSTPWTIELFSPKAAINSPEHDWDPIFSRDGLELYLASNNFVGGPGVQDIVVARRASRGEPFGAPTLVPNLNTAAGEADPTFSPDELVVVFASNRTDGVGGHDLWYATRLSLDRDFEQPHLLPGLNTVDNETEPTFSPDGRELYFASDRPGGQGSADYYRVLVLAGP